MERFITRTSNQISAKVGAFFSVPKSIEHNDGFSYPIWLQYVVMSLLMGMSGNQTFFGHGYGLDMKIEDKSLKKDRREMGKVYGYAGS